MLKAAFLAVEAVAFLPISSGGFKQLIGANNIGLDKFTRAANRAVDMTLGSEMHDGIDAERGVNPLMKQ